MLPLMETVKLGPWAVLPTRHRLRHDEGAEVVLEPKVMQVLLALLARPGEVVRREELLEAAWPGEYVTEHVLSRSISELRKALGDDHRSPRYIETIRKGGFRLIVPVAPRTEPEVASRRWVVPAMPVVLVLLVLVLLMVMGLSWAAWRMGRAPVGPAAEPVGKPLLRPLTSFMGSELDPVLSPDGGRLAFSWSGVDSGNFDIYVKALGEEEPLRLTEHPGEDKNPAWSPDGDRLAFVRSSQAGNGLFVVPLLGGVERKLVDCVSGDIPDLVWSVDGRFLFFPDREVLGEPSGIFRLDIETREKKRITRPPAHLSGDRDLTASPDGSRIVFARAVMPQIEDLYIARVEGGAPRRLTFDGRSISGIEWLPQSDEVLFSSDRDGTARMWSLPVDGGAVPRLRPGLGDGVYDPSYSPNAARLVYERRVYDSNIWHLELGPSSRRQPRPRIASTRMDILPVLSPDGSRVAFLSGRSGEAGIWVSQLDGSGIVRLTDGSPKLPAQPSWTPDGEALLYALLDKDQSDLYRVSVHGGGARRLTSSSWNEVAPQPSGDGERIYFGSDQTGEWQIWSLNVGSGESLRVTQRGGIRPWEAPDGEFLYYSRRDRPGIWRVPRRGGREVVILTGQESLHWSDWTLANGKIYFRSIEPNPVVPSSIFMFDPETSSTSLVFDNIPGRGVPELGLAVSPHEDFLLYASFDQADGDILLAEGFR